MATRPSTIHATPSNRHQRARERQVHAGRGAPSLPPEIREALETLGG